MQKCTKMAIKDGDITNKATAHSNQVQWSCKLVDWVVAQCSRGRQNMVKIGDVEVPEKPQVG